MYIRAMYRYIQDNSLACAFLLVFLKFRVANIEVWIINCFVTILSEAYYIKGMCQSAVTPSMALYMEQW